VYLKKENEMKVNELAGKYVELMLTGADYNGISSEVVGTAFRVARAFIRESLEESKHVEELKMQFKEECDKNEELGKLMAIQNATEKHHKSLQSITSEIAVGEAKANLKKANDEFTEACKQRREAMERAINFFCWNNGISVDDLLFG
jgi:hypothetical protein